jgi:hypothetical protein
MAIAPSFQIVSHPPNERNRSGGRIAICGRIAIRPYDGNPFQTTVSPNTERTIRALPLTLLGKVLYLTIRP